LKPQPRGQSSPVCSVRRQLPGRRTSVFRPTDRGCEREPRQVRALPRGTPGWQVSGLPRIEWIGSRQTMCLKIQLDGGVAPGTLRRRAAIAWPLASLNSNCHQVQQGTIACTESCRVIETTRTIEVVSLPRLIFVPQRSPTVRRVTHLGNCEQKTKNKGKFPLRFTDFSKSAPLLAIPMVGLLKLSATRQETRRLQWKWCGRGRASQKGLRRMLPRALKLRASGPCDISIWLGFSSNAAPSASNSREEIRRIRGGTHVTAHQRYCTRLHRRNDTGHHSLS